MSNPTEPILRREGVERKPVDAPANGEKPSPDGASAPDLARLFALADIDLTDLFGGLPKLDQDLSGWEPEPADWEVETDEEPEPPADPEFTPTATRATARAYLDAGHRVLPDRPGTKKFHLRDISNLTGDEINARFDDLFPADDDPRNVAVMLGEGVPGVGYLYDGDADCPEAERAADEVFPLTMTFGRVSKLGSHRVVILPGKLPGKIEYHHPIGGSMIFEVKGPTRTDRVTVLGLHESGEVIHETSPVGTPAARMTVDAFQSLCARTAAAALLGQYWNPNSGRHKKSLALAGWLLRKGWAADVVRRFIQAICAASGETKKLNKYLANVGSTAASIEDGLNVTGLPKLIELFGASHGADGKLVCETIAGWLTGHDGPPSDPASPVGEPAKDKDGRPLTDEYGFVTARMLAEQEVVLEWLIENVLVKDQAGIIAGPLKTLKTSTAADMAFSLASGEPFLGRFPVPKSVRVAFVSGESGRPVIRKLMSRIAESKGANLADLGDRLVCRFDLPRADDEKGMRTFLAGVKHWNVGVVFIDPWYLYVGEDVEMPNSTSVGRAMCDLRDALAACGATAVVLIHMKKNIPLGKVPTLGDIAYGGTTDFARQWMLLNRRTEYTHKGNHDLLAVVGGSAGHSSSWPFSVSEGEMDAKFGGQVWLPSFPAEEAATGIGDHTTKSDKIRATLKDNDHKVLAVITSAIRDGAEAVTKSVIRADAGLGNDAAQESLDRLMSYGRVEKVKFRQQRGKGAARWTDGYRLVGGPEDFEARITRPDHPSEIPLRTDDRTDDPQGGSRASSVRVLKDRTDDARTDDPAKQVTTSQNLRATGTDHPSGTRRGRTIDRDGCSSGSVGIIRPAAGSPIGTPSGTDDPAPANQAQKRNAKTTPPIHAPERTHPRAEDAPQPTRPDTRHLPAPVAWLAETGIPVDHARAEAARDARPARVKELLGRVEEMARERGVALPRLPSGWSEPEFLRTAFAPLGVDLAAGSDGDHLLATGHPLALAIADYRSVKGSKSALDGLCRSIGPDGRVYPVWKPNGAVTGRLTCANPPLHSWPKDLRHVFAASPGRTLVQVDYRMIEMVVAAVVAQDEPLLDAVRAGRDLHAETAAGFFGKRPEDVTPDERQLGKRANFGLQYGVSAGALALALSAAGNRTTVAEAQAYLNQYFAAHPALRAAMTAPMVGDYVETLGGRRIMEGGEGDRPAQRFAHRVQGSACDGFMNALALLFERRGEFPDARPVIAAHDALVVECPDGEADDVARWVERAMTDGMAPLLGDVPARVGVETGRTWGV